MELFLLLSQGLLVTMIFLTVMLLVMAASLWIVFLRMPHMMPLAKHFGWLILVSMVLILLDVVESASFPFLAAHFYTFRRLALRLTLVLSLVAPFVGYVWPLVSGHFASEKSEENS